MWSKPNKTIDYVKVADGICDQLREYIEKSSLQSLIIGVSGGVDSAVCTVLASTVCKELKIPLIGRSIPILTNTSEEKKRSYDIGSKFCDDFRTVDLSSLFSYTKHEIMRGKEDGPDWKVREGNIKARLRMIYLFDIARRHAGAVIGTDNLTEYLLGYWTLHGDVGNIGMIQNLWKTEVFCLGRFLAQYNLAKKNIDEAEAIIQCVQAVPTAGLGVSVSDLGEILPDWTGNHTEGYEEVDRVLYSYLSNEDLTLVTHPVIQRHLHSEFKRNDPYNFLRII